MLLFCGRDCSSHTMGNASGAECGGEDKQVRADSMMARHNSGTQGLPSSSSVTRERNRQAIAKFLSAD